LEQQNQADEYQKQQEQERQQQEAQRREDLSGVGLCKRKLRKEENSEAAENNSCKHGGIST